MALQTDDWSTNLDISQDSAISIGGKRTLSITPDTQIELGGGYALIGGASLIIEATQRLADSIVTGGLKFGCGLSIGVTSGITLKLRYARVE